VSAVRRRWPRPVVAGTIAGVALLVAASAATGQTTTTTSPSAPSSGSSSAGITITGEGSNGPYKEVTAWQNDLAAAQAPINLQYTPTGTLQGRGDFVAGNADFALSGTQFHGGTGPGFTPAEINQLPHQDLGRDVIAAPVQVTALALLMTPVFGGFQRQDYFPGSPPPQIISPVTRQVRIPWPNLSAMLLNYGNPDPNPKDTWSSNLNSWDAIDTLSAMLGEPSPTCDGGAIGSGHYICFAGIGPLTNPSAVWQSEGDELNYYMQVAIRTTAPDVWSGNKAADKSVHWEDATNDVFERMPRQPFFVSRQGADQAGDQLTIPGSNAGVGPVQGQVDGAIGVLPPTAKIAATQGEIGANPLPLEFAAVKNANGDWVVPSPQTIDAAVNASSQPLYALTHTVPNATPYPLTWVNYLYVKSSGLSAVKTEALATLIRYLATDGQAAAGTWGEGTLSKALVAQAVKAADQVVQSNCPGAKGTIVKNSDPGPNAPSTGGIKAIGAMLHCVPPATPAASAAGGGVPAFGIGTLPGLPSLPVAATPALAAASAVRPTAAKLPDALTADRLPLPLPGTPRDWIATLLVGGLGYVGLRGPIRRMLGRAVE
jgi:ABC-type phosphate transport system substrate-binding protein